jgi:putative ABC transport system permease protein
MVDRFLQDIRFALRQIVRHPGVSALLILTVAVAIGANVAIFSVLEGIVLRPLPYPEADRLLAVWETPEGGRWYQPFTPPDYFDVREQAQTLDEVGIARPQWINLSSGDEPDRIRAGGTTASLFRLLGVQPLEGRLFTDDEELEGNQRVTILSHALWRSHFGGEPGLVGREILLDGEPFEIIGIMPPGFRFPTPWGGRDATRLWFPQVLSRDDSWRGSHFLGAYARMADNVTPEEVEAELAVIASRLAEAYPNTNAQTRMWIEPIMARTLGRVSSTLVYFVVIV